MKGAPNAMHSTNVNAKASVRWPLRIFAALIVLAGGAAIIGEVFTGSSHHAPSRWQLLASLPGTLWLVRLAWHAAVRGMSPAHPCWPFATDRLLFCYMATWLAVYFYA